MQNPSRSLSKYEPNISAHDSLEEFMGCADLDSGLHVIPHSDSLFTEILYDNRNAPTTIVFFNGAGFASSATRPGFTGTSMMKSVSGDDVNRIYIHDATLYHDPSNSLTWYAGCSELQLQRILPEIIGKFLTVSESQRTIFFGVSGGAYAALYYSTHFPGSLVLATNPQTILPKYHGWEFAKFSRTCWGSAEALSIESAKAKFAADLTEIYSAPVDNYVYYLNNASDTHHVDEHLRPFARRLHKDNHVQVLIRNWGEGLVAPVPDIFLDVIRRVVGDAAWSNMAALPGSIPLKDESSVEASLSEASEEERFELIEDPLPLTAFPLETRFPKVAEGTLVIKSDFTVSGDVASNAFMVSLWIEPSNESLDLLLKQSNSIRRSNDSSIGFFVLLPIKEGENTVAHKVYIPQGCPVSGFSIRHYGKSEASGHVEIKKLAVHLLD
ncbi:hypothetical protein [Pseudarthrobacter sp. J47]|uniref:hypothetical protein n=1 Tax=Pseudarthrobacter sp. J47 TaxID=3116482 RepID=UPI002E80E73B|nr:hypothetical protein [Pseudarthrobacter sp. J47]MEE2524669.1 hypothetical protein [Pseudarthrobacter sp. J47]